MKRSTKTIGITLSAIVVIVIILGAVVVLQFRAEIEKMSPVETGEIRDGIYAVKDQFVNLYLVKGSDGYLVFDAGDKRENVERELKNLNIEAGQVRAVFLTHTDGDHIRAVGLFKNARIFISEEEEQMINGQTPRFLSLVSNSLPARYEKIKDNQTLEIAGISVKGILTPGHTPGSMCYLVNGRDLFTGDSLSLKEGRAGIFSDLFNMDSEMQKKSLHRLKMTPDIKFIYSAHHGTAENRGQCFERW